MDTVRLGRLPTFAAVSLILLLAIHVWGVRSVAQPLLQLPVVASTALVLFLLWISARRRLPARLVEPVAFLTLCLLVGNVLWRATEWRVLSPVPLSMAISPLVVSSLVLLSTEWFLPAAVVSIGAAASLILIEPRAAVLPYQATITLGAAWIADHIRRGYSQEVVSAEEKRLAEKAVSESLALAKSEAERAEARFRRLSEAAAEAVLVFVNGRVVDANESALSLFGYSREEIRGMALAGLLPSFPEREFPPSLETMALDAKRRRIPVEVHGQGQWENEQYSLILAIRDLTERRRAEAQRLRLEQRMAETQRLESLGLMAGGVAHDFNNILAALQGHAELATLDLPPDSLAAPHIAQVLVAARRAAELTNQMLAFSGRGRIQPQPLDLAELAREMLDLLATSISPKARVHYSLPDRLPWIHGDPAQIRQVVLNLITNASDALGEEEGTIYLGLSLIDLGAEERTGDPRLEDLADGPYLLLEVADSGCGMSPATLSRIFDPFFTTKFAGRGLGLAAVQGIVRGHGGAIRVQSELGRGTRFHVYLPTTAANSSLEEPLAADLPDTPGTPLVLVVDDEAPVRQISEAMLKRLGYQVLLVADGRDAVKLVRTHRNRIDVILLDLTMPGMGGSATFDAIRAVGATPPVVFMSGHDTQVVQSIAGGTAGERFLAKPFSLKDLELAIGEAIRSRRPPETENPSEPLEPTG